ncbi:hypothetical protein TX24_07220 [Pseudomonas lactis]|nr:hypothetical protein TX24_07220 [Pseudomonas lactis]
MILNLSFLKIEALAMHPLNGIKGSCIGGASSIDNFHCQQLLANANDIHRSHLQLFINFKKLTVELG